VDNFPAERGSAATEVFQDVITLVCGAVGGVVESAEQRTPATYQFLVRTAVVYHLIYNLRCRVLMDRHGFWYAEDLAQYSIMRSYCEGLNKLPQQVRRQRIDGMPSAMIFVYLNKNVDQSFITAPLAPQPFDMLFVQQQQQQQQHRFAPAPAMAHSVGGPYGGPPLYTAQAPRVQLKGSMPPPVYGSVRPQHMAMLPPPPHAQQQQQQRAMMMSASTAATGFSPQPYQHQRHHFHSHQHPYVDGTEAFY
jgi:hypothetical protein